MKYKIVVSLFIATFCVTLHGMKRKAFSKENSQEKSNSATKCLIAFCKSRSMAPAQALLGAGADIHCEALHISATDGDITAIVEFLKQGADVNAIKSGVSPLHCAAVNGYQDTCEFLINKGAKIEAKSIFGNTPLHSAARSGSIETCKLLLSKDARKDAKNNEEETPLDRALKYKHTLLKDLLMDNNNNNDIEIIAQEKDSHMGDDNIIDLDVNSNNNDEKKSKNADQEKVDEKQLFDGRYDDLDIFYESVRRTGKKYMSLSYGGGSLPPY